jgi:hypothetical protein
MIPPPRHALAFVLALSGSALAAQKPPAGPAEDTARANYRGHGLGLCVAELRGENALAAADAAAICGCALDRIMPRRWTDDLPELAPGRFQSAMGGEILSCTGALRPALASVVARRLLAAQAEGARPADAAPPPVADKPAATDPEAEPAGPAKDDAGAGFTIARPAWLDALPLWTWILLAMLGFALLRALFRGRDERRDLLGPPPGMRPRNPVPPPAPRPPR